MTLKMAFSCYFLAVLLLLAACTTSQTTTPPDANLPNPASVYCEGQGGKVDMRQDEAGNTAGICVFPDGSECDEWAFFRGECHIGDSFPADSLEPAPIPTANMPEEGWWVYTHDEYGFEISLPQDWVVEEITSGDPLMNGHLLELYPRQAVEGDLHIRMTFRRLGEDTLLWPTGVGSGELLPEGTLEIAGEPANRVLFVCPGGQVNNIYYHGQDSPNIRHGNMEFGFILGHSGVYCQEGYSLGGKSQQFAEKIIASLKVVE